MLHQKFQLEDNCNGGSAILKLNTIEDKLLSKYFKLLEILKRLQKKKGAL
jgi:hypothetical protein